jgi:hypothetical protein
VALQFKKASSVALGTFNIYIIQPHWLTKVGILPAATEITIEANMSRPGFRLSSPVLKSVWLITPGRLAIETADETEDCGRLMAEVLQKLPMTPVFAVGNNISFQSHRSEIEPLPVLDACAAAAVLPEKYTEGSRQFVSTILRDKKKFTLQVTLNNATAEFSGNAETQLGAEGIAESGVETARQFTNDKGELLSLFSDMFGVKPNAISHA